MWYEDVGYHKHLGATHRLKAAQIPQIPWCTAEVFTVNSFPSGDVTSLLPNTLYRSRRLSLPVGEYKEPSFYSGWHSVTVTEYFCVCHEQKHVYLIQVTHQPPGQPAYEISRLRALLERLAMVGRDDNPGYKLCIVSVVDWADTWKTGVAFSEGHVLGTGPLEGQAPPSLLTIDQLHQRRIRDDEEELYSERLETYVVRACLSVKAPCPRLKKKPISS